MWKGDREETNARTESNVQRWHIHETQKIQANYIHLSPVGLQSKNSGLMPELRHQSKEGRNLPRYISPSLKSSTLTSPSRWHLFLSTRFLSHFSRLTRHVTKPPPITQLKRYSKTSCHEYVAKHPPKYYWDQSRSMEQPHLASNSGVAICAWIVIDILPIRSRELLISHPSKLNHSHHVVVGFSIILLQSLYFYQSMD